MWMLSFIPDAFLAWVVNTVLIAGAVGFVASFFFGFVVRYLPVIAPYRMFIQIVSIFLLVAGVYFKGGYSVEMEWRSKVAELEEKVKVAEEKSKQVNEKIVTVYKDRVKTVKETQIVVQEKIKEVEKIIDAECKLDPRVNEIVNKAATNPEAKK